VCLPASESSIEQRGEFIACLLQADLEQGSHRADR
jgi:hypothetical protein